MLSTMPEQPIKSEQMQMYDNNHLFVQTEMHSNMMGQEVSPSYGGAYDMSAQADQHSIQGSLYGGKGRLQYVNAPKIVAQETSYSSYSKG